MPVDEQAALNEYIGHRNYDNLSSRSPDDDEDEVRLYTLHTLRSVAGLLGHFNLVFQLHAIGSAAMTDDSDISQCQGAFPGTYTCNV